MKIYLTATGGGHYEQLKQLDSLKEDNELLYVVTDDGINKENEDTKFIPQYRIERKIIRYFDLIRIFFASYKILKKFRPDVVISTGAAATYPACWLQKKIFKKKVIFIESFAKRTSGTKTGKKVYKFADYFIVQWEEMKEIYPNAIMGGKIY